MPLKQISNMLTRRVINKGKTNSGCINYFIYCKLKKQPVLKNEIK